MSRLTDTQLLILSRASQREDGFVDVPPTLSGAARSRVIEPLLKRGYLKEAAAPKNAPVWRRDEALGPFALTLTKAGEKAIGVAPEENGGARKARSPVGGGKHRSQSASDGSQSKNTEPRARRRASQTQVGPRAGSKLAAVIALLERKSGASLDELIKATGWLPHTARAALTGLRKRGYAVDRERGKNKTSRYRIAGMSSAEARPRG